MDGGTLDSSSEDEYDVYVNSVALLKALQTKGCTKHSDALEENTKHSDTLKENTKPVSRRKGRRRQRNTENCYSTYNGTKDLEIVSVQEDLEIVSVQDGNNISLICDDTERTAGDPIILNISDEEKDENYDINVKVLWQSKTIHRLNLHNYDNFRKVFQYFADMENVSIKQILITKKDKRINVTDTPSSIGLSIIDILEGGIIDANVVAQNEHQNQQNIEENVCQIKVQTGNKESLTIPLKKDQQFKILIAGCARQLNVSESSIKLYFDGEPINANDTPGSLDLEEEACIDLCISTK